MARMIQIRNVPDRVHRELKARAAMTGKSLSDFLLDEIRRLAEVPPLQEMLERLERLEPEKLRESPVKAVRVARDSR